MSSAESIYTTIKHCIAGNNINLGFADFMKAFFMSQLLISY